MRKTYTTQWQNTQKRLLNNTAKRFNANPLRQYCISVHWVCCSVPLKCVLSCLFTLCVSVPISPSLYQLIPYTAHAQALLPTNFFFADAATVTSCTLLLLAAVRRSVYYVYTILKFLVKCHWVNTIRVIWQPLCVVYSFNQLCLMILNCPEGNIYNLTKYVRCQWSILYRI